MAKIVIIGAGSGFGGRLSVDILSRKALQGSHIALCDIDEKKLDAVTRYVRRVVKANKLPAKVSGSADRRRLLKGADFVITSISVGGAAYHSKLHDLERNIPAQYGVHQTVADTIGVGGVFRFLRTAPVQLGFCHDVRRYCPDAIMINYTNPMAMLSWLHSAAGVKNVGLCHSVQHTVQRLAGFVGVPSEEVGYWVAGINHQAWFLKFHRNGTDLYPKLRRAMNDPETYRRDAVRFELMKHFGYFVTESSGHNAEYVPYFRRTPRCGSASPAGVGTRAELRRMKRTRRAWLRTPDTVPLPELKASDEYASGIIEAVVTGRAFRFNASVPNAGVVTNLPEGSSVEVPCTADGEGVHPCVVGELPPQCAALNRSNIAVQELAVRAVLDRDKEAAFHACALDPLTASVAPLDDIRKMFEQLWRAERKYLTYFSKKK